MSAFAAIAAMSLNRVIGSGNAIPWHLPEDFKWFKSVTMGHVLVMGRKTFESIGRPLPGRETVVLTRGDWTRPGVTVVHSLEELIERPMQADPSLPAILPMKPLTPTLSPSEGERETEGRLQSSESRTLIGSGLSASDEAKGIQAERTFFIAGGAEVYRQALPLCEELLLTLVKREVEGDAFFPPFEDQFELVEKIRETPEFDILRYRRRRQGQAD